MSEQSFPDVADQCLVKAIESDRQRGRLDPWNLVIWADQSFAWNQVHQALELHFLFTVLKFVLQACTGLLYVDKHLVGQENARRALFELSSQQSLRLVSLGLCEERNDREADAEDFLWL